MGKILDIVDLIMGLISWFFEFLSVAFQIIIMSFTIALNFATGCPAIILIFISLFVVLAVVMFVWRLIP